MEAIGEIKGRNVGSDYKFCKGHKEREECTEFRESQVDLIVI